MEDYDGLYDCLFCGDSVRGMPALVSGNATPTRGTAHATKT